MSEYREDRTTGTRVLVAPERGGRPVDWARAAGSTGTATAGDPSCPFCPGNEQKLAEMIEEIASDAPPGWRARVVANRFPALTPADCQASSKPTEQATPAHGFHEVIIETPNHDADLVTLSEAELNTVLLAYRRRYIALMARPGIKAALVFRNYGERAGATLRHPHSQVMAATEVPPRLAATMAWARTYHAAHGRCATCAELDIEIADGRRVVEATDRFAAIVPFAAATPFEQRIVPRIHQASFAQCDDGMLADLGGLLQRSLRRLKTAVGDPAYNFVIEPGSRADSDAAVTHWWLRIVPHVVRPGGFELGAGMAINPSWPENDAETLRAALSAAGEAV